MPTTESSHQSVPGEATTPRIAANKARRRALIALGAVGALLIALWFSDSIAGLLPTQPFKPTTQTTANYRVTLALSPNQPHVGKPISAQIALADAQQHPIKAASITYTWEMLTMDMGTATGQATANLQAAGSYGARVSASMGGSWRLTLRIHSPGQPDGTTSFIVHVQG